ncbi:hypothetical protein DUNSADRAFT_15986 [Dunaliella salina]|uniref:Uncharacterized protein n=1 Tax=Dunaliella salina TaxID=3046 RepID=A0ABQ7G4J8_DUNSA|nr:hypothetical protein DUNSADRAFT_15986 [Dunaliella salina]|eukprot:KAF5829502.1 hypothetical protein DUNSADRAFT_15986 [Dunaliella salina]
MITAIHSAPVQPFGEAPALACWPHASRVGRVLDKNSVQAPYSLGECLRDLLDFSARMLVIGGRLVLFIPATPETYKEEEIPRHPALKLIYNSRRLVTYEKLRAYNAAAAARYHEANPDPTLAIDRIHDIVYDSYERDANGQVIYPDGALNAKKFRSKRI